MAKYLFRRVALSLLVLVGVVIITFIISRVVPGDPARLWAGGARATPEEVQRARLQLGLDQPLLTQFANYVLSLLRGDIGISFITRRPVIVDIGLFLPATLELVIPSMLIALLVGIPIGVVAGAHPGGQLDRTSRFLAIAGAALPAFVLALVGQAVFAVWLGWLPVGGRISTIANLQHPVTQLTGFYLIDAAVTGNWTSWIDSLAHLVLPVLVLAVYPISLVVRQTRASVADVMSETYILAARASGLPEHTIQFRFALRNAIIPTLTVLGLTLAASLTGTVLIEVIFSWPGIGRYVTDAIQASDFPAVMAVTIIGTVGYVMINLVVDLVQATLDPRVRLD